MARSAEIICDASTAGSEDATGGSGRGLAVGADDGVAVAMTAEAVAEMVADGDGDPAGPLETAHALSNAVAHAAAARLMRPLARTPRRAREGGRARGRSA